MKLKTFNSANCSSVRSNKPAISINTKSGLFNFNAEMVGKLGLKEGMLVVLHQNEDQQEDWYLEVVKADGFPLRKKETITKGLLFNNAVIARAIADSVSYQKQSGKLLIGADPIKLDKRVLWPIITANLRN